MRVRHERLWVKGLLPGACREPTGKLAPDAAGLRGGSDMTAVSECCARSTYNSSRAFPDKSVRLGLADPVPRGTSSSREERF